MPNGQDPISQATSEAIDAINPIMNTTTAATEDANKGGEGAGDDANANNDAENQDGANQGAQGGEGDGQGADGGQGDGADDAPKFELTDVVAKEVTALDDNEKAFIVANQDDLTLKQIKAYKEAGIDFGDTPIETKPAVEEPKLHEVPESDDDLTIEVEDAEGNKHKLNTLDDLPEDFVFKDSRQPIAIANKLQEVANERARREQLRTENNTTTEGNAAKTEVVNLWQKELTELQEQGVIEKGDADFVNGKFGNSKIQQDVDGLFTYMTELNTKRAQAGLPLLVSLKDVQLYRAADQQAQAKAAEDAKNKATKNAKAAVVAGSQTSTQSGGKANEPTYVQGSGLTIDDIVQEQMNNIK